MPFYHNATRFAAIVTLRISVVQEPKKVVEVGMPSAMKAMDLEVGVHDLLVSSAESIELGQGVEGQFLAARAAL